MSWRALVLAGCLLAACQRRAPGPAECQGFAAQVIGLRSNQDLALPSVVQRLDEVTRECLTTPFDRTLLRCVELGGGSRRCLSEFERRRLRPRQSAGLFGS